MNKNSFKLAGHTFTLENVRYGIHSEETVDFMAELYCDGVRIAEVENDGHGGSTFAYYDADNREFAREVEEAVRKEVWLTCMDGTVLYYDLGTVADEILSIIDRNNILSEHQGSKLVLEDAHGLIYTSQVTMERPSKSVKYYVDNKPGILARRIAEINAKGYKVLNTNIPDQVYEDAKLFKHINIDSSSDSTMND